MNCLKKILTNHHLAAVLFGVISGIAISLLLYPNTVAEENIETTENDISVGAGIIEEISVSEKTEDREEEQIELEYLGEFDLTAYCSCEKCCDKSDGITASGVKATASHTIAVDPKVISYGSRVIIDGHEYVAEDCGGAIKKNHIDIYFDTHHEALNFGKQKADVYLIKEGGSKNE